MIMRLNLRQFAIAALLLPWLAVSGCNTPNATSSSSPAPTSQSATQTKSLKVVTTFLPMYLFTKAIAGDTATVEILIKPGTEVHEYQSSPADVQAIAQADVLVKNGMGIEEFLDGTVKNAANAKLKVIEAAAGISPLVADEAGDKGANHDHSHDADEQKSGEKSAKGHSHPEGNPHVWLDPRLAKQQVETIRDGLIAADPPNKGTYQANAAVYLQKLSDLDKQFEQRLKGYKDRTFITFHDAFAYLAKRYQLQQIAVVEIPEDQLSPADVQKAVNAVKQHKVKALLSEPGVDNKLVTTLAQDLRLTVRSLDSLEAGQLDPQHYFTAMNANLQTLEAAFE